MMMTADGFGLLSITYVDEIDRAIHEPLFTFYLARWQMDFKIVPVPMGAEFKTGDVLDVLRLMDTLRSVRINNEKKRKVQAS